MKEYTTIIMPSPELGMDKRIYIMVPKKYNESTKHYPVLYMHDGQNLFDDRLAFQHTSWHILDLYETDDTLPDIIIVGIESDGMTRNNHLIPFPFAFKPGAKVVGGEANHYLEFITRTVKPYIDQTYRTKRDARHTAIIGSSFGGVNSVYAMAIKNDVFSRFASISGAFHYDFKDPLFNLVRETDLSQVERFYMDNGTNETTDPNHNEKYMKSNAELADILRDKFDDKRFVYTIIEDGRHHETDWEARFPDILRYLFE
jgi:predicted alpha/beta superfamily hydrolase